MSLLKLHTSSIFEFQKDGYSNLDATILNMNGNYIPAWNYTTSVAVVDVYIQEIDIITAKNKIVKINKTTILGSYTTGTANDMKYAIKQAQTLDETKIYRLLIDLYTGNLYSDLFRKIS